MNENDRKGPANEGENGHAAHGYRNEVNWEGGSGRQPYTNQGTEEQGPASPREYEAGNAGDIAGGNVDQLEQVKQKEDRTVSESRRET